jgi:prepilin-type processing-associated H-X9-DG protein/prepilin-type N-terminal cleavage/methylation domain-containing protein
MKATYRRSRAFSMTELLVVIAVILILAALIFVGANHVYSMAMQTKCQHRLEQIGHAIQMYRASSRGFYPRSWDPESGTHWFEALAGRFVDNPSVFGCPSAGDVPFGLSELPTSERHDVEELFSLLRWLKDRRTGKVWQMRYGYSDNGTAITGLALLGYLGAGCTDRRPEEFADVVRDAIEYIVDHGQNKSSGLYHMGNTGVGSTVYQQGICLMAMSLAARTIEDIELRQKAFNSAVLGAKWLTDRQPAHGCFGYSAAAFKDGNPVRGDVLANGFAYMGLGSAMMSGVPISSDVITRGGIACDWNSNAAGESVYGLSSDDIYRMTQSILSARLFLNQPLATPRLQNAIKVMTGNYGKTGVPAHLYFVTNSAYYVRDYRGDAIRHFFTSMACRRLGDSYWKPWYDKFIPKLLTLMRPAGTGSAYIDKIWGNQVQANWQLELYTTAVASSIIALGVEQKSWTDENWYSSTASCSYGYNDQVGQPGVRVSGDTILVMDYQSWVIFRGLADPERDDSPDMIALRHGSRANALFADGAVRPLSFSEIRAGMFTPSSGD